MRLLIDEREHTRSERILVVNPNSIEGFSSTMQNVLQQQDYGFALDFYTAPTTVSEGINGMFDSLQSATICLGELENELSRWQAIVIACFSAHPMVPALRERVSIPIVSILEAPLLLASMLGARTGILTSSPRWELLLARDVESLRLDRFNTAGIISSGMSVLELEQLDKGEVTRRLVQQARSELLEKRRADVIVLGCAGMVGLDTVLSEELGKGVTVLCPVKSAVALAADLLRLGLSTSKVGVYA